MAMDQSGNPLVLKNSQSDRSPDIQLHPLVIISISDQYTRNTLRKQGPTVGAIFGQQNGREISMESAFEVHLAEKNGEMQIDSEWFSDRADQMRDVLPGQDLVGWYTTGRGPQDFHVPIQRQLQQEFNCEPTLLLILHEADVDGVGGDDNQLPITAYESVWVSDSSSMEVDGPDANQILKFRQLSYSVDTSEAEMIATDHIARGAGNAAAVEQRQSQTSQSSKDNKKDKNEGDKSNGKAKEDEEAGIDSTETYLTAEDDETIASLRTRANAIKMLKSRLDLLSSYLKAQPASYLTDASLPRHVAGDAQLDHQILRSISALTARQALLSPSDSAEFENEAKQQNTDVALISLLTSMTRNVSDVKQLGKKWHLVEPKRRSAMHASAAAAAAAASAMEEKDDMTGWSSEIHRTVSGTPLV